jgi:hypothetical protein
VAVRPGFLVGDGIAHIDHHIPRVAAYSILARSHHARTVAPGRNVSRARVIAASADRTASWCSAEATAA